MLSRMMTRQGNCPERAYRQQRHTPAEGLPECQAERVGAALGGDPGERKRDAPGAAGIENEEIGDDAEVRHLTVLVEVARVVTCDCRRNARCGDTRGPVYNSGVNEPGVRCPYGAQHGRKARAAQRQVPFERHVHDYSRPGGMNRRCPGPRRGEMDGMQVTATTTRTRTPPQW